MKNFNYSLTFLAIFALLLTSCSKEETDVSGIDGQETFQLQFNANLNDFNRQQQTKDHLSDDPVVCRDADPAYVLVALTDSNGDWVADKNPEADGAGVDDFIRLDLKLNGGGWETLYSPMLGLPAGTYNLEYFIVYSADDQVLWVAPREGGAYEGSVGDPLPQIIVLGAGTKPYVEVDVLCYVPRMEEAYGHIFFDINAIAIESNYCIFVNYCDDGTGREYPAMFEVDVWGDGYDGSDVVVDGAMNSVSGIGNDFAATVLCMALPPLGEGEVYYVRVSVLDAGDYASDASDFVEFTITQADIDGQPAEVPAYEHLRINCEDDDGNGNGGNDCITAGGDCDGDTIENKCDDDDPNNVNYSTFDCDGDTILNGDDNCPERANPEQEPDQDCDGIIDSEEAEGCVNNPDPNCGQVITCNLSSPDSGCSLYLLEGVNDFVEVTSEGLPIFQMKATSDGESIGTVTIQLSANNDPVITVILNDGFSLDDYRITVKDNSDSEEFCESMENVPAPTGDEPDAFLEFTGTGGFNGNYFVKIESNVCP